MTNAKKRGIHVEIRQFVESGQPVAGNASELREVFTNLILNALDAMPFGGLILVTSQDTGTVPSLRASIGVPGVSKKVCPAVTVVTVHELRPSPLLT